jgi:hypothetical protein
MRSTRAFVATAAIVLSYPLAVAVQLLFGQGADTVIHLVTGTGFLVFATSVVDFGLSRWVNLIGGAAAGVFWAIFILQGVSDLTTRDGPLEAVIGVDRHHQGSPTGFDRETS